MSKSSVKPLLFSKAFGVKSAQLNKLGVFDISLNLDTRLFPDPLLLEDSKHKEMRQARDDFETYFDRLRRLLAGSKGDQTTVAWKSAKKLLHFPEIKGTCLGYGTTSISGSGVGADMRDRLLKSAYEIVDLGIDDPDLFLAMGLFEENFGPDLIGDMFTNVCLGSIIKFNARIYDALAVSTKDFEFKLKNGKRFAGKFPANPVFPDQNIPVILLPKDILRDLPIALDWAGVQEVSSQNDEFRQSLNSSISDMWSRKTLESKDRLKRWALSSDGAFGNLLDMLHGMDGKAYDFQGDKMGEVLWRTLGEEVVAKHPLKIAKPVTKSVQSLNKVVDQIIEKFRHLVEDRDLWKDLYVAKGKPRFEQSAQRMFYAVAQAYCEANDIDISPEANAGRGPVDFKFSRGFKKRILLEVKLSTNKQLVHGYEKQLALYDKAEKPAESYFLIVDVGNMGKKLKRVEEIQKSYIKEKRRVPHLRVINGRERKSASKA